VILDHGRGDFNRVNGFGVCGRHVGAPRV
jgi:hypothetical protein